ncbi:MAG: hypothetical protein U9P71_00900 [Campylobacterota bacterium]|nr:hypothetical protein [Campylobacterota bacterium]
MLNVRDLEQQWLTYKIKSYYPYLFSLLAILLIIAGIALYINSSPTNDITDKTDQNINTKSTEKDLHVNIEPTISQNRVKQPKITSSKQEEKINTSQSSNKDVVVSTEKQSNVYTPKIIEPSFSFLDKFNSYSPKPTETKTNSKKIINTTVPPAQEKLPPKINTSLLEAKTLTKPQPKENAPAGIKINRTKTQKEIQDIIRRFNENKSPALGLYLARYYYKIKNYQKSYNYALNTNHVDANIEESWLIFASSQAKLDKRDDAIKTLIAYIKNSDSINAKNLLRSIRSGEFR